jgi:hypothetical protein
MSGPKNSEKAAYGAAVGFSAATDHRNIAAYARHVCSSTEVVPAGRRAWLKVSVRPRRELQRRDHPRCEGVRGRGARANRLRRYVSGFTCISPTTRAASALALGVSTPPRSA